MHQSLVTRVRRSFMQGRLIGDSDTYAKQFLRELQRAQLNTAFDRLLLSHDDGSDVSAWAGYAFELPEAGKPKRLGQGFAKHPKFAGADWDLLLHSLLPALKYFFADLKLSHHLERRFLILGQPAQRRDRLTDGPLNKVQAAHVYIQASPVVTNHQALRLHDTGLAATFGLAIGRRVQAAKCPALAVFHRGTVRIKDVPLIEKGGNNLIHEGPVHGVTCSLAC